MRASIRKPAASAFIATMLLGGLLGCAGTSTTVVKTETVTQPAAAVPDGTESLYQGAAPAQRETTVTTTTQEDRPTGILGSAVNLGGAVIAFPFRVVGATLGAIF
jgi:hypothetical protein